MMAGSSRPPLLLHLHTHGQVCGKGAKISLLLRDLRSHQVSALFSLPTFLRTTKPIKVYINSCLLFFNAALLIGYVDI